ncbi:hypothetical protein GCM10023168_09470 [Fodinibacter luteus]|uniref:ATP synthase protein I n=1 Tax=Fodinibacter luteus TaxID=552064 RepID=A0ABP8K5X4_9MICO
MTDRSTTSEPHAGAPFGAMLRGALLPSVVAGLVAVVAVVLVRGGDALAGAVIGLVVAVGFFASGMFLLSRLVRDASPHAFFAVAMAVYLGQVLGLLFVIIAFKDAGWVDGPALGIVALVVTLVWQVFAMRALRRARVPVYDRPADDPASRGSEGP